MLVDGRGGGVAERVGEGDQVLDVLESLDVLRRHVGRSARPSEICQRQAVLTPAASCRPSSSTAISRIRNFWTLPVTVIGKPSTNFQWRGILKDAIRPWQ